jgi:hypothetical protein
MKGLTLWPNELLLGQSIRAGSMPIYEDTEGTSNGLSRVSQLTASPALFDLLWLGCLPRIMAGEQNKKG